MLLAALLAVMMLTTIALLSDLSGASVGLRFEDLESGRLWPMYFHWDFWRNFPVFPSRLASVWDSLAFGFVIGCWLVTVLLLRYWCRAPYVVISGVVLGLGLVPMMIGTLFLSTGEHSPAVIGAWWSFMTISLLYASIATGSFLAIDLSADSRFRICGNVISPWVQP